MEELNSSINNPLNEPDEALHLHPRCVLHSQKQRETDQSKNLTEQELRDLLIRRERKVTEAERSRQRNTTDRPKYHGMDFGFD